ncbi:hypothetical protein [Wocania ichthyoenteri]|uniref:hypothetical protein n=1 Tax=Wocania ichthyoenteri TaxID=1230531 RepID=UPI00053E5C23|nr:hypothetical protein [Wocania ichthyoenteri]
MKLAKSNNVFNQRKALCFVNMNAHYPVLKEVSHILQTECNTMISFYFYSSLFDLTKEISDAKTLLFDTIVNNDFDKNHVNLTSYKPIRQELNNNTLTSIFRKIKENKRKIKEMNGVINNIKPSFVLISDNTINYDISLFVKACKINSVDVFCVPFGLIVPNCILERLEKNSLKSSKSSIKSIVSNIFPKYILKKNGNTYLPKSLTSIAGLELIKAGSKRPWTWNAHNITGVFVDSVFSKEFCLNQGLPLDKIILTQPIEKSSYKNSLSREELTQKLSLDPNLPILLFNVPAPLLGLINLKGCDFNDPKSIIYAFLKLPTSIRGNANLIWTLHPRLKKEDYLFVESMGIKIIETSGAKLISACDVFIGNDSTLFKTALFMSKPIVNYQVFGLKTDIFKNEKGYYTAKNKHQYINLLEMLLRDISVYNNAAKEIDYKRFGNDKSYPEIHEYLNQL